MSIEAEDGAETVEEDIPSSVYVAVPMNVASFAVLKREKRHTLKRWIKIVVSNSWAIVMFCKKMFKYDKCRHFHSSVAFNYSLLGCENKMCGKF